MKPLQVIEQSETSVEHEQLDFGSVLPSSNVDAASLDSTAAINECSRIQKSMLAVRQAIFAASGLPGLQSAMASHLQHHCHAVHLCWHAPAGTQIGQTERLEGLLSPAEGISSVLRDYLKQAAKECTLRNEICSFAMSSKLRLFALPVPAFAGHSLLLVSENQTTPEALMAHVTPHLLMLSSFTAEWAMRQAGIQSAVNARSVAAMIELVAHVHSADDVNSACQRLVDSLQHYLKADRVVVGLCRRGASEVRVAAVSGGMVVDRFSEETRLVESVLQESLVRSACGVWPVLDPVNRHALLSHQQLAESGFGKFLISVPIRAESGEAVGSLLVVLAAEESAAVSTDRVRDVERFLRAGAGAMVVEIGVPEEDVRHVTAGMTVDIQLEAVPEEKVQAVIRSVHPRAELLDGENVFIAEADIPNNNAILRPGMRGLADVSTRRHSLGWNLFHKPAAWLAGVVKCAACLIFQPSS